MVADLSCLQHSYLDFFLSLFSSILKMARFASILLNNLTATDIKN